MQHPSPKLAEPILPQSGETSTTRGFCYAGLAVLLALGGWMRFSDQIAGFAPGLAAPGSVAAAPAPLRGLVELALTPAGQEAAQIQAMQLPAGDAGALQQAVSRRRVRLVQMPLFENDGASGGLVQVSAGGLTRIVALSPTPTVLTLPIAHAGTVSFSVVGNPPSGNVGIGAITLSGPVGLPRLAAGQTLEVGVIAQ